MGVAISNSVDILGTSYSITYRNYDEDSTFAVKECMSYCQPSRKAIVMCTLDTHPYYAFDGAWAGDGIPEGIPEIEKQGLRHEIVHAFLEESGLSSNSHATEGAWADDEEIVDWFAMQGEKIYNAWRQAGAAD